MKELVEGQGSPPDPRRQGSGIEARRVLGRGSALQGGGWGIYGDFLASGQNRFGGGIGSTAIGPQGQTAQNLYNAGNSAARRFVLGDKKANPGRDVIRLMKQETPGSSCGLLALHLSAE
jgi:hypothetical protein